MAKIDLEKFICSFLEHRKTDNGNICDIIQLALENQGLEYRDGQIVEISDVAEAKPFEIKAGQWYMCIKSFEMSDGSCLYIQGHLYQGDGRGCLRNERGNWSGYWGYSGYKYFRPATEDEILYRKGFKDEDWIVCEHNNIIGEPILYKELKNPTHQFFINNLKLQGIEPNIRPWTIQDAKDGDVLCYKDEISLYKRDIKNYGNEKIIFGGFVYHCCYNNKRFITDSLYSLTEQDEMYIHPATKEQRDTLIKAMADAGYTFDFVKKELKRIEQKNCLE